MRLFSKRFFEEVDAPGRPLKCINYKELYEEAYRAPTKTELLTILGISSDTFNRLCERDPKFKRTIEFGGAKRKEWLRKLLYEKAESGDTRVLLHLARNLLGHVDKPEVAQSHDIFRTEDQDSSALTLADACREAQDALDRLAQEKK